MNKEESTSIVAGTILQDDQGRFLLVQEGRADVRGLWNIPAGRADVGETPAQAAVRETQEEVGLTVELIDDQPVHVFDNTQKGRRYCAFRARIVSGTLTIQEEELMDAQWLAFDAILMLDQAGKIREPWIMDSIRKVHANENPGY